MTHARQLASFKLANYLQVRLKMPEIDLKYMFQECGKICWSICEEIKDADINEEEKMK